MENSALPTKIVLEEKRQVGADFNSICSRDYNLVMQPRKKATKAPYRFPKQGSETRAGADPWLGSAKPSPAPQHRGIELEVFVT